jgi:hypothetical protein
MYGDVFQQKKLFIRGKIFGKKTTMKIMKDKNGRVVEHFTTYV